MNQQQYHELCRAAGERLQLARPDAVAQAQAFYLDDIECRFARNEQRGTAQLVCEMDDPLEGFEAQAYRRLLELHAMFVGQVDAMFARDAINDRLLFVATVPIHAGLTAAALADFIRAMTGMVAHWRDNDLRGLVGQREKEIALALESSGDLAMLPV